MLFNFRLRPLSAVTPWGAPPHQSLHWFGLTDGWYWLQAGADELLRYNDALLASWPEEFGPTPQLPYVDYHVVRLWEDVQALLTSVLEPVPEDLIQTMLSGESESSWLDRAGAWLYAQEDEHFDAASSLFQGATDWLGARRLNTSYLQHDPSIYVVAAGPTISIYWDSRGCELAGVHVWQAEQGTFSMAREEFLAELRAFDARLMGAMRERVDEARAAWPWPDVHIDLDALVREHHNRTTWLERVLERAQRQPTTDWERVREDMRRLDRRL